MTRVALLIVVLTLTIVPGAVTQATSIFQPFSTTAPADSAKPINSDGAAEDVPVTDRVPWMIYVVLTSATVALAWILFSLARAEIGSARRTDKHET